MIRENSAKYVSQMGNSYFQPKCITAISPPISFLHLFREPISIIALTKKSKIEENCRSECIQ